MKIIFFFCAWVKKMVLERLDLTNFRNFKSGTVEFTSGINLLIGANAQGKTNTAEAVFFLCTGYSPRATRDKELIRAGEKKAEISCRAKSAYGDVGVSASITEDEKTFFVNGVRVQKMADLFGNVNSVFFNPSELKLVQESPEDRRRFMNVSLSEMSRPYFTSLCRYNKILAQRNNLLKSGDYGLIRETLSVWDEQFSEEAAKIFKARNDFLSELRPLAKEKHAFLTEGKENLELSPENAVKGSVEEIKELVFIALKESFDKDVKLGFTNVGPHREDIKFTLNKTDVKKYGSQGQQRTVALSLKLAEAELFKNRSGEYPVLILDDVLSELDKRRQRLLVQAVQGLQTVLTATHVDASLFKSVPHRRITVENGSVKSVKDKE